MREADAVVTRVYHLCALYRIDTFCRHLLVYNEPFIEHLKNLHFDLAVVDASALALCPYLLPHRLGIPFATYADWTHPLDLRLPWLPSFVPLIGLRFTDRMTFAERLGNTLTVALLKVMLLSVKSLSDVTDDYRRLYGHFDSLDELAARSLVWLYPRDHVLDYARPAMPHVISVGGLTVRRSSGQVPTDLEDFIKHAPNGVILVSFGSVASSFPVAIIEKMMNAFRQLDGDGFRFIFRLKDSRNVTVPDNVLIRKWIPQNDLLGHESTKLFITHCGNNGQYEAVYHGVPMIGFPLFSEQPYNARRMEQKGLGIEMDILSFSSEELVDNVRRIVSDGSYKDRAAKASAIFRADPQSPVERAAYWIEHVCRFGGDHLRSGGQDLAWYAYLMLDILAFLLTSASQVVHTC
jgi:UDP:flavonoid glycosyltransferase YjiC (YdhE family)